MAIVPVGSEFRVNTYTTNDQRNPAVALDADGDFVVTWISSNQDGSSFDIYAQRYNADGTLQGDEFRVNTYTTSTQSNPAVAIDADGDFVVTWNSYQDGSSNGIYAQRYNAAGIAQGAEFRVNTYTTSTQSNPAVAIAADGDFVVTWNSYQQDGSGFGIYAQRYNSNGIAQGDEFRVNTYTTSTQSNPAVAIAADGDFVVTWNSDQDGSDFSRGANISSNSIYARRYNAAGIAQGAEFRVNTYTTSSQQSNPAVAIAADGDFVVTWNSYQGSSSFDIYAQRYNAAGIAQGAEFRVNTYTTSAQLNPDVAIAADGDFVVTWQSYHNGSGAGIYAQRYNAAGIAQGAEFRVNTYTTSAQRNPAVAIAADGDAVVTWDSYQDGSGNGIYAQRFVDGFLTNLSIAPDAFSEAAGANAATGTITLDSTTTSPLTVTLTSNDTTEATVPTQVTIPGGSASTSFTISAVDDLLADGFQLVTLTTSGSQVVDDTANIVVTDNEFGIFGTPGVDSLFGTGVADSISGLASIDTLNGLDGNDTLNGGTQRDVLTGGTGADRFIYSAGDSLVAGSDRITDFDSTQGDRFQVGFLPNNLFNVRSIRAATVSDAAVLAYSDNNGSASGTTALGLNQAILFGVQGRAFLSVNTGAAAFESGTDLVVEVTNIVYDTGTPPLGALTVGNYFA